MLAKTHSDYSMLTNEEVNYFKKCRQNWSDLEGMHERGGGGRRGRREEGGGRRGRKGRKGRRSSEEIEMEEYDEQQKLHRSCYLTETREPRD